MGPRSGDELRLQGELSLGYRPSQLVVGRGRVGSQATEGRVFVIFSILKSAWPLWVLNTC